MRVRIQFFLPALLFCLAALAARAQPNLLITEFVASNNKSLNDEDGESSDWIEIYNAGTNAVSLEGWYLTDTTNNLTKWRFPNVTLLENSYLVVFASEKNRTNPLAKLHTNFKLSADGEYLALVRPDGTNVASQFAPQYPAQQTDISYGRDRVSPEILGYFTTPTPGGPNASSGPGFAPEVQFSRPSGTFPTNAPFLLTLSTPSSDAVIYYTLSTNAPGTNTLIHTNSITVTNSVVVRARAFQPGLLPGPISTKTYIGLSPTNATGSVTNYVSNVLSFTSGLPIMILHNFGRGAVPAPGVNSDQYVVVQTFEPKAGVSSLTNTPDLTEQGIFHRRGSSTADYAKGSFFLEVRDEFNADKEVPLLGLPKESDWVLYAPNNFEPALFHNPLAFDLARQMGEYASRTRFVEVYLKDNTGTPGAIVPADYNGIYVLMEKIKRDKNRVDIEELKAEHVNAPEVTGGYILSIDRSSPGERPLTGLNFSTPASVNWIEPNGDDMTNVLRAPQVTYMRNYLNTFNTTLTNNALWTNPVTGYAAYINVGSWVNRHIHEVVTFNVDALRLSGYFFKDRNKKLEYGPAWDYDRTQGSTDGRDLNPRIWRSAGGDLGTDFFNFLPWWGRLFKDPDFWQAWIDRYQQVRQDVFSNPNVFNTVDKFANQLYAAQPRELARWNIRPRLANGTGQGTYATEVQWKKNWYSNRLDFIDGQFLRRPTLSSSGGEISAGFTLGIVGLVNSTYYTLDGTDPRLPGGGLSPNALLYAGPIILTNTARVMTRVRDLNHRNLTGANNPPISSPWSGPAAATFVVATPPLVITEIMYHPADPPPGGTNDADDFEYVELKNIGPTPLDLTGFRITNGIEFSFTGSSITNLDSAELVLIVKNQPAFLSRYPGATKIAGEYSGNLNNAGERLYLEGPLQEPILDFAYQDSWYPSTDGLGFSLVIVNENAPRDTWGLKASWRPSGLVSGSPGENDPPPASFAPVVINEALTRAPGASVDTIELHNPSSSAANIGGWFLTDDLDQPKKFRITDGTMIAPGGFRLFNENDFNAPGTVNTPFSLSANGDEVYLLAGNAATNLSGYVHGFQFGAARSGVTFGRHLTSAGDEHFVAQIANTLGATNAGPRVGPVVLNEIMYHPPNLPGDLDDQNSEYLELFNPGGVAMPLYDPAFPTNTWQIRGGVEFDFPINTILPAQSYLLLVSFDPVNSALLSAFRSKYGLSTNVPVLGPYSGKLDNSAGRVELLMPDAPADGVAPYTLVDAVDFQDNAPWPVGADGVGPSLQRKIAVAYGNDPVNWIAALPTAGGVFGGGSLPTITVQPTNQTIMAYENVSFHVSAEGSGPPAYQWRFNGAPLVGATNSALSITNVLLNQDGLYSAVAFNAAGSVESTNARLTVLSPATITVQPKSTNVFLGTNVTLSVLAFSSTPATFQWRYNGTNILGATSSILVITNIQPYQGGKYTVLVTDGVSSVVSAPATVIVKFGPLIVQQPQTQTVVQGEDVTFSVRVLGTTPFGYRWRSNNVFLGPFVQGKSSLTLTNVQLSHATFYDVSITNLARPSGVFSDRAVLAVLADSDGDRIPNNWEIAHGFNTNSASDAALDADGDGMTNFEEYKAGTDPHDVSSALRLGQLVVDGTDVRIGFRGVPDKKYRLEGNDDLSGGVWRGVVDFKAGVVLEMELIDTGGATRPNRMYRLILLP